MCFIDVMVGKKGKIDHMSHVSLKDEGLYSLMGHYSMKIKFYYTEHCHLL